MPTQLGRPQALLLFMCSFTAWNRSSQVLTTTRRIPTRAGGVTAASPAFWEGQGCLFWTSAGQLWWAARKKFFATKILTARRRRRISFTCSLSSFLPLSSWAFCSRRRIRHQLSAPLPSSPYSAFNSGNGIISLDPSKEKITPPVTSHFPRYDNSKWLRSSTSPTTM